MKEFKAFMMRDGVRVSLIGILHNVPSIKLVDHFTRDDSNMDWEPSYSGESNLMLELESPELEEGEYIGVMEDQTMMPLNELTFEVAAEETEEAKALKEFLLTFQMFPEFDGAGIGFCTPAWWNANRSDRVPVSSDAITVILHEGRPFGDYLSIDRENYSAVERLAAYLASHGYYTDQLTEGASAVHRKRQINEN